MNSTSIIQNNHKTTHFHTMTTNNIFFRSLTFCWLKLGLGLLNIIIDAILIAVFIGIAYLFDSESVGGILLLVWLGCIGFVNFILNHYLGYMVKAGHVAVIAESFHTGQIPDAPFSVGKRLVIERFGTANVYFGIDKLVGSAVKQVQRMLGRLTGGILNMIPGGEKVQKLINWFVELSLGYIDECCLCYTFYKKENNAWRSAADGVVLYAQNWKALLKNAAWIMLTVSIAVVVITLLCFLVLGLTFRALEWYGIIAFVLSLMLAWVIKYAFIDSWIMVKMVHRYMTEAQTDPPAIDLYGKLSGWSTSFRELFKKGEENATEQPASPTDNSTPALPDAEQTEQTDAPAVAEAPAVKEEPTTALAPAPTPATAPVQPVQPIPPKPHFCTACGAALQPGQAFCGSCGTKVTPAA